MPHWHLKQFVPSNLSLHFDTIKAFILGTQNYEKGVTCLSGGGVRGYRLSDRDSGWDFLCWVVAEKDPSKFYLVKIRFDGQKGITSECVCKARNHKHARCKHQAAALLGLVVLRDNFEDTEFPRWFATKSRMRFWNPGTLTHQLLFGDWTMPQIVKNLVEPLPATLSGKKVTTQSESEKKVTKSRKKYCWCSSDANIVDAMMQCSGCKNWFHYTCIQSHGMPNFDPLSFRGKDFICVNCESTVRKRKRLAGQSSSMPQSSKSTAKIIKKF